MKLRNVIAVVLQLILLLGVAASSARAANVGIVVSATGDVEVKAPGSNGWSPASPFLALLNDSRVKIGAGGSATVVLYKDGSRYQGGAGSTLVITDGGVQSASGPAPARLAALKLQHVALLENSKVAGGRPAAVTSRDGQTYVIELHGHTGGPTLENFPTFAWEPVPNAVSYNVNIMDLRDNVLWRKVVTSNSCVYPMDAPSLKPGIDYIWGVKTSTAAGDYGGSGIFQILEPDKKAAVLAELDSFKDMPDESVADVMRVETYTRNLLWDDAIMTYKKMAARTPASPVVLDNLANLLVLQDRKKEAAYYHDLADKAAQAATSN